MDVNLYLLLALLATLLVIAYLLTRLHRVRGQLSLIKDALMDIKSGNLNRRVLVRESDMTKQICYDINEIAMSSQSRLIQQKQSEQAYKRLMTSLSHDVKTPLASLVGYLEAVESKMVTGAEQEEFIRVAAEKAHHLKEFVTVLFEWVKLDAGEQIFHFERCDLNELSRNIMADWVPLLESHDLTYEIEIPETEYMTRVDSTAYTRPLNNLLQNILTHSVASQVSLTVTETEQQAKIVVADNGIAESGTHEELLKNCEVYLQIAKSQLSEKELGLEKLGLAKEKAEKEINKKEILSTKIDEKENNKLKKKSDDRKLKHKKGGM